jgi:hypothetical protein
MFEETKQTLTGVSFVRRKIIIKKNAGVSTQTFDQRVATRVVSREKIIDRGEVWRASRISPERREKRILCSNGLGAGNQTQAALKQVAEPNLDQMRRMIQQLSVMLQTNTQQFNDIASNLATIFLNTNWVLDSDATDHMTGDKNLLNNYKCHEGKQFVVVANGDKMKILGNDLINFFSKNIQNALHVRNYASNLISISKITNELNCEILFSSMNVIFQERITKRVIGEGYLQNGLYNMGERKYNFNIKKDEELGKHWHKRIGHPSDRILNYLFDF